MTIETILKVLYGILGIWLGIGVIAHSFQHPDGPNSKIFMLSMICLVVGTIITAETVSPGSIGTLIKSMFITQ